MEEIKTKYARVILNDKSEGKGEIIVITNNFTRSFYWGAMGDPLKDFLKRIDSDYFAGKLCEKQSKFSIKLSVKEIRRYIREEMSYELPWYKYMEGQKELRRVLRELEKQTDMSEETFVQELLSIHNDVFIMDMKREEEKEFLEIVESIFVTEPWNFIQTDYSDEYKLLMTIHKDLIKKL